jgi:hypothetical protein
MSEDLAIDVGLAIDTDEYDSFVATVDNILELGCQYTQDVTENIIEKCKTSELAIAKRVISACQKKSNPYRSRKLKWWQTYNNSTEDRQPYNPKRTSRNRPEAKHRSARHREPKRRREPAKMELFERNTPPERFKKKVIRKRGRARSPPRSARSPPRSARSPPRRFQREYGSRQHRRRPMSPMFQREHDEYLETDVPRWPSKKRKRYR